MPLVFDGIHRAEKMSGESSSTASNNNQLLATANHHDNVKQPSTDIATTTTKQSNSTRQYKSKNNDKDIIADSMSKDSADSSSSTNTANCNAITSSSASMASSNRRQSIHRSVKSTKQPIATLVSSAASTSNTSTNSTSSTLQTTTISSNQRQEEQYQENDTFLSLSNPTYKSVLYTHFQQMNNNDTREEEKRMATKIRNIFKENGGRFYKKNGRGNVQKEMTFVQVDEDAALRKIQDDIRRRRENAQHWQQQQQTSISPSAEVDIPSLPITTTQSKTDKKKKSSKKSISIVRREAAKLGWERRKQESGQSKDDNEDEDMVDEDGSSMSKSSPAEEARMSKNKNNMSDSSTNTNDDNSTAETLTVVKKEIKKRESKARTVKLTHPHASDVKAQQPSPTSTSSTAVVKKEKKKSKTPVKKTKKSIKPSRTTAGKSQQKTTTIRAARPSEKKQADAQQVVKSNGMTEWQCPKCSKKFAWKSPQCAGACISNHMRNSHGITLPTMKELSQKKKETKKKSVAVKSSSRHVIGGTSRPSRSSGVSTSASSSSLSGANQQPKQQEKTKKRGRESSTKKASVTFDSDIQSYLGEEPVKKKKRKSDTTTSSRGSQKISVKGSTPSKVVASKSKRAAPSRRQPSAKTNHVTPTSMQKTNTPGSTSSLVVIESSSSTKKSGTNKLNFAQKLHAMIMDADDNHPDTLCWNEDGDSFIVKERDTPLQPLLSRYFRTAKYTSLYRSLTNYGFVADYIKIQEKDVVCFMREDFTRDSTPTELACFTKDKSTTAEKIVSIKEEAAVSLSMPVVSNHDKSCPSANSRRSVPKRKAFTNACGVIQGAMTEEDDTSPTKDEEEGVVFEVGQRIESRYRGQGRRWYKGTIVASLGNGLYDIDYDDGDNDRGLSADAIRFRMPRRKKITKKKKQQQKSAEQSRIGEDDDMMFDIDNTFNNNTQQHSAPLLNERQRIIFDLVSGREDDSVDKENTNKTRAGLFSPIKAKRVTFANVQSTNIEEEERGVVQEKSGVEVVNDSSFSPIKSFDQVKPNDSSSKPPTSLDTSSLAKSTTQTLSSTTQVIISGKSQEVKKEQMQQPFVLVKVGVIDNEVLMPPSKEDDDTSFQQDTTDAFQGLLSPESDSNTPSSKDPGDDLFQFNWDGRASSSDDFLADEIGYDLFSTTNRITSSSSYSSRRGTYASGRGTTYPNYPSRHGKARTSSSWDKIRL